MKHGKIIYDVSLGSNLHNVIEEVIQIANTLNSDVHFKFNGTDLIATKSSSLEDIYLEYHRKRESK